MINLKDEERVEILCNLIEEADVVVEHMRIGVMERLGFSWKQLHEQNWKLIYCSIMG